MLGLTIRITLSYKKDALKKLQQQLLVLNGSKNTYLLITNEHNISLYPTQRHGAIINTPVQQSTNYFSCHVKKRTFEHMRQAMIQISLRIRAV